MFEKIDKTTRLAFMISKEKWDKLQQRLKDLGLHEADMIIKAVLGSGPGGQKVNKCSTTIYIKHIPTSIEIKYGKERSQSLNQYRALCLLCDKYQELIQGEISQKAQLEAKIRRQKQRRSRKSAAKAREQKKHLSEKKELRQSPTID